MKNILTNVIEKAKKIRQRQKLHKFWNQKNPRGNNPEEYFKGEGKSEYLFNFIKDEIPKNAVICEIGCNVGRNLNYLYKNGYTNLIGIEISDHACKLMKERYDVKWKVLNKPVEKAIKDIKCDCFYSMAVLEHIPYDSEWIFDEMKKAKWIVTIEDEVHGQESTHRHFARNYKNVFTTHKEIKHENCQGKCNAMKNPDFEARLFKR